MQFLNSNSAFPKVCSTVHRVLDYNSVPLKGSLLLKWVWETLCKNKVKQLALEQGFPENLAELELSKSELED
jgi:hypothetical protein